MFKRLLLNDSHWNNCFVLFNLCDLTANIGFLIQICKFCIFCLKPVHGKSSSWFFIFVLSSILQLCIVRYICTTIYNLAWYIYLMFMFIILVYIYYTEVAEEYFCLHNFFVAFVFYSYFYHSSFSWFSFG